MAPGYRRVSLTFRELLPSRRQLQGPAETEWSPRRKTAGGALRLQDSENFYIFLYIS